MCSFASTRSSVYLKWLKGGLLRHQTSHKQLMRSLGHSDTFAGIGHIDVSYCIQPLSLQATSRLRKWMIKN
ncbi:unnamed protein product [Cylicocyclus nassatus]|uniref:Uncharacterized protein n=1 Tax=Cylicocyclus nassatus TaxID=53992 RepID=A0AA36GHL2_CYLNA|nr:unnamed protein product [Cylicocyclus nassatus]